MDIRLIKIVNANKETRSVSFYMQTTMTNALSSILFVWLRTTFARAVRSPLLSGTGSIPQRSGALGPAAQMPGALLHLGCRENLWGSQQTDFSLVTWGLRL